ncbi:MAG: electron transfer flavoprotein subunit alpha/FixB family protein [Ignavibacterium sp.]|nr:electron transfer flavoprotein subunit alpha/FixB family protein [Ignavibacterium sp.]MDW8376395.1 electron transfer flavoprotein subunit alpha/FixB family protein [Ignavibacteriales bacterium]
MANKILAVLEQREGQLKKVSFEVISLAKKLSTQLSYQVEAIIIGNEISNLSELKNYFSSKVTHFKNQDLNYYSSSAYSKILSDYINENDFSLVIFPNTAMGIDLAPRVAVRTKSAVATDCIKVIYDNEQLIFTKPVYAGKALINFKLNSERKIITIRPNIFKPEKIENENLNLETKEISDLDLTTKVTGYKKSEGKLDVAEADIIVSGGRGMKGPENFHLIEELAEVLGAAVGASRAVVDAGWRPHREQVGQTGKTVSPTLYIACGISGAIQHLAGMSSSKYIVAINKDKDAPIFNIADYGITADALEILPVLIEEIKKIKS